MCLLLQSDSFLTAGSMADDDLVTRIRLFLENQCFVTLRRLDISARNGTVVVAGRVGSFYERQVAIARVQRVAGVRYVVDEVIVE